MFTALRSGPLTLYLIEDTNLAEIASLYQGFPDSEPMLAELFRNYLPAYDKQGRRTTYGFYSRLHGELAGMTALEVDGWDERSASTGADIFEHMRGRGVTPASKPHLFYLAFELLGLNRVATGHAVSNISSQRSLAKTPGLVYEGRLRESGFNAAGELEDELLYSILRRDWQRLYDPGVIEVIP